MFRFASLLLLSLTTTLVYSQESNNDPKGKSFFVSDPSCDSYKCQVTWEAGHSYVINWLNPLEGKVDILLNPEDAKVQPNKASLPTYHIAKDISATHNKTKCNKYGEKSCGAYLWKVPKDIKEGLYSVDVHSLTHKKVHGTYHERRPLLCHRGGYRLI